MTAALVGCSAALVLQRRSSQGAARAAEFIAAAPSSTLDEDLAYFASRSDKESHSGAVGNVDKEGHSGAVGYGESDDGLAGGSSRKGDGDRQVSAHPESFSQRDVVLTLNAVGSTLLALVVRDEGSLLALEGGAGTVLMIASLITSALAGE
jgi:hypothetical protein